MEDFDSKLVFATPANSDRKVLFQNEMFPDSARKSPNYGAKYENKNEGNHYRDEEESSGDDTDHSKVFCTCKNSKCLKLYCHCFRVGKYCGHECQCVVCKNTPEYEADRQRAVENITTRNPMAFKPRLDTLENVVNHG